MSIYSLSNPEDLNHDVQRVFDDLDKLYAVDLKSIPWKVASIMSLPSDVYWTSPEANEIFNKFIPHIKSLHLRMYSIIESIIKAKTNGNFRISDLEKEHKNFKEWRLMNNNIKHFEQKDPVIEVLPISFMNNDPPTVDIGCQFKYKNSPHLTIFWGQFILVFLAILSKYNVIETN